MIARSRVRARPRGECCHVYSSSAGFAAVHSILFIFASVLASSSLFLVVSPELVVPSNNNIEISKTTTTPPAPNEFLLNPSGSLFSTGKSTSSSTTATAGTAAGHHLIEDATCDVEQLEKANDSQLHVILVELMTTGFFRNFAVDLDQTCPLSGWDTKTKKQNKEKDMMKKKMKNGHENNSHGSDENKDDDKNHGNETKERTSISFLSNSVSNDEEQQCEGGLPDLDSDAEPACSIELGGSSSIGGENSWLYQSGDKKSELMSPVAGSNDISGSSSIVDNSRSGTATEKDDTDEVDADKDDEFECSGGKEELDDDAEPLCSLAKIDDSTTKNPFGGSSSFSSSTTSSSSWDKKQPFESLALRSISQRLDDGSSWESESQA